MLSDVSQFLFTFGLVSTWQRSNSSVNGEPQGNWRWNSNSRDIVASSPSFSHPAGLPEHPGELAHS